jgi:hypothetical protein
MPPAAWMVGGQGFLSGVSAAAPPRADSALTIGSRADGWAVAAGPIHGVPLRSLDATAGPPSTRGRAAGKCVQACQPAARQPEYSCSASGRDARFYISRPLLSLSFPSSLSVPGCPERWISRTPTCPPALPRRPPWPSLRLVQATRNSKFKQPSEYAVAEEAGRVGGQWLIPSQRLFGFAQIFAFSLTFMSTWEGMCSYDASSPFLPHGSVLCS